MKQSKTRKCKKMLNKTLYENICEIILTVICENVLQICML